MTSPHANYDEQFLKELETERTAPLHNLDLAANRSSSERTDAVTAVAARIEHIATSGGGLTGRDFERAIGVNDLVPVNYLERGLMAARAVCRIAIRGPFGDGIDWGTGFLVSPRLLITNNHVFGSVDEARRSTVEFGYERDASGNFRVSKRFAVEPDLAFITDEALDFTLVSVADRSNDGTVSLANFGFLRLNAEIHKIEPGEFVSIIQHPGNDEKFAAIRENKVIKIGDEDPTRDNLLWYYSDTAPGSSGAPVFNDSWQVVAIHHRGVPITREQDGTVEWQLTTGTWVREDVASLLPDDKVKWIANEGVRASRIVSKITERHATDSSRSPLVQDLLDDIRGVRSLTNSPGRESIVGPAIIVFSGDVSAVEFERGHRPQQNVRPINFYAGREGYDPDFLGVRVDMPTLTPDASRFGEPADVPGQGDPELRYTHFSVFFNATRRLASLTAVNIDGKLWDGFEGGDDQWFYDPRLPLELQVGEELYGDEPRNLGRKGWFDRGHLVRRLDPVWGTIEVASAANGDTFHWTNCAPQYWAFNQGQELWQGLENFILYNTDQEDVRANVFTGPVFQEDDEEHRGVRIPQHFWKVVVVRDGNGKLYSSAYVVSQSQYARNIPFERLPVGGHMHFQVSISKLESRTGLRFPAVVRESDVFLDSAADRPLRSFGDIKHPRR